MLGIKALNREVREEEPQSSQRKNDNDKD